MQGCATELPRASSQRFDVCRKLSEHGISHGQIVAIGMPRSTDMVATMLAVLMTGAAYCVMDERWPKAWVDMVRREVEAVAMVTNASGRWEIALENKDKEIEKGFQHDSTGLDAPFCVYHTSGTTGKPKAVITSQRGVLRTLLAPEYPSIRDPLVMGCSSALAWDALTLEIWFPLLHGGKCVLFPELTSDALKVTNLTIMFLTAARFNVLVEEDIECLRHLKELLIGGERLSVFHVRSFVERFPNVKLISCYGPAEANIFTTTHLIHPSDCSKPDGIPLGDPLPGTEIQLISTDPDGSLSLTPENERGEIAIAGDALALGYTTMSAYSISDDPFVEFSVNGNDSNLRRYYLTGDIGYWGPDGNLLYCGRGDSQIKLHGQRIDPFEIEQAMLNLGLISHCVVTAQKQTAGSSILLAHVVPSDLYNRESFLSKLRSILPSYQVPAIVVELDHLPLSATGKVDRKDPSLMLSQMLSEPLASNDIRQHAFTTDSEGLL